MVRADYGEVRPWVHRQQVAGHEVIVATAGPDRLVLRGPRLPQAIDHRHADEFTVEAGDVLSFSTTWFPSHVDVPAGLVHDDRIAQTIRARRGLGGAVPGRRPARRPRASARW